MVRLRLPGYIMDVLGVLGRRGYEAYVVGGAVRDLLLGLEPADYDVATSARPWEVARIFEGLGWRVIPKGVEYGVVGVLHPSGREVEVATFRREVYPRDYQRRLVDIEYADTIEEDLARRDFTINAMAYSPEAGLVDPYGGLRDLREGVVRFVGEPRERIREDPLRMLRAVRFAAKLGFRVHPEAMEAVRGEAGKLRYVSRERIGEEVVKAVKGAEPYRFPRLLYESCLHRVVLPELEDMRRVRHDYRYSHYGEDVLQHTVDVVRRLAGVSRNYLLRLAGMLHDVGKPYTARAEAGVVSFPGHELVGAEIARRRMLETWRRSRAEAGYVERMVREHMRPLAMAESLPLGELARRLAARLRALAPDLALHAYADTGEEYWLDVHERVRELLAEKPKPLVTGHDILALGVPPGPMVRELKQVAYELQLQGLSKQEILERLRELVGRGAARA